ncbi:ABC transporter ATP-binding protein [Clostridium sartagoforme]|uniref:ABC transporter ATP-binding protein n=1 Tax=Clostridium sartagoforme TaxID=84031 RepID=A0A4S2DTB7_9CLOT|nr:ABC transporter ATP-binding protein [Clostridium sartagoforme]TGY44484.1 ABC transporter ATP-binding protein [Clostridium sartagoforme]
MEAIEIKELEKSYNKFKLDIKELIVKKGFITGFIGPNGSGKTTTIKAIMNMVKADKGEILVLGEDIKTNTDIKETLAFVGDTCGFLEESKLKNIKKTVSRFYTKWDETLYKKLTEKFGLDESLVYGKLSKGKKKQFELTMALATKPKVLIMDEPTANLDPVVRNEFLEVLQEQMEEDENTVFYSTHITSDLEKCADYIIFIYKGQVILQGEKDYILETHSIVKGKNELLDEDTKNALISVKSTGYNFEGLTDNKEKAFDVFGKEVIYERANLEDIMLYYTGRK